jgi:cell fate (sporulation/competence/biofilm development) regulator YlbF (YheA/YmcA/DUF963 family)
MTLIQEDSAVMLKTRELCATLAADPAFLNIRDRIAAFMADDSARENYDSVSAMSQSLQHKQRLGNPLAEAEIAEFEAKRDSLMNNPVAKGFLDAQEEMQQVRQSIGTYVMKTFELGRLPEKDDFHSCGHGCSCGD